MYGLIEQLNILARWKSNDSTISLSTPIGIDGTGRMIYLDIHEKYHGPHGLIAGSTGSGKSEFIITYILSLAINYSPKDVAFVLIDYKGGGLAGAFQKKDMKLPHLVGTITNIDTVGLQRSLASIQSELKKRQIMFNEARDMTNEGTMDIYKYQKLYHDGVIDKPIPHLLIICDEFAELKQQQPEFMDELISVSRIGRSLGVHLILATQKPAGIVNEQIRSNSKFAICLKVQAKEDSNDVIKKTDAANLKGQGQFYIQVGNDEYFNLGQSAWSGAPYYPSNITPKIIDNSIKFISNIGSVIKQVDDNVKKKVNSQGEQLTNIVKYICDIAQNENVQAETLWLDNIPENIFINDIKKKYKIKNKNNSIISVIGEYDAPLRQEQGPVILDFSKVGNTTIFGNAESGKETLLSTIIYDLMKNYTANKLWMYILDFGTEALKIFKDSPNVGDVVNINESEKIGRFFDFITKEIRNRKTILSDYNGDYNLYLKESGKDMPIIVVILNNYEAFNEVYEKYDDVFLNITREGVSCGILFVMTLSLCNSMRYRLSQNFKQKIVLQLNNDDDYGSILEGIRNKRPSKIFGRGLIPINDEVYEFQTAKICLPEEHNFHIREEIEKLKKINKSIAPNIPILPDKVMFQDLESNLKKLKELPIGITKNELKVANYDFKNNFVNIITAKSLEDVSEYTYYLVDEIRKLEDVNILIFDMEKANLRNREELKDKYNKFVNYLETNQSNNDDIHILVIFINIDKFFSDIENNEGFSKMLKIAEEGNYSFIIADNSVKLKNHTFDTWYKNYVATDTGIWVGNGFDDQYIINVNGNRRDIVNNCGRSFGYVVKSGKLNMVKLLEMKEKSDDDE